MIKLKKYIFRQSSWVSATDMLAMTLCVCPEEIFMFKTYNLKSKFNKDKDILIATDSDGVPLSIKIKSKYHNIEGMECNIYPEFSPCVMVNSLKRRIREIDYLMSTGKIPPEGTKISIHSGLLQGKSGVVVGSSEGKAVVRFYDSSDSYMLSLDIGTCRLLSGVSLNLPLVESSRLFK